ncbi:UDP-glycosyltransferase UGT5-like [Sitodiplosis mosellana]|uniref:UDP-glycosyltransferase UGT5-like n=1 Tax=Sitodiplosis mosellana TaxID=263140 RepID=UPI002444703D|nr:UDP-glycosyltransferase UGT5-like [Sitodiplosis mosellana]
MKFKFIFVLVLLYVPISFSSNILYLSILPSHSHHFWNSAISNELAKRGHNITIVSPDAEIDPPAGVNYIILENQYVIEQNFVKTILNASEAVNPFHEAIELQQCYDALCSGAVETDGFRTLLNYPDNFKFDLIVHDFTVGSCLLPFLHKFNYPPMLAVTAFGHPSFVNDLIGGHHYYAYVPHMLLQFDDTMTFVQRFLNFLIHVEEYVLFKYYLIPRLDAIAAKYFGPNVPSVGELEQRAALAFVNTHPVMETVPLPQNVIPVAGVQIKEPRPLQKDLRTFIDSSKKGAVVFSLGSNFRSDYMPAAKQQIFLKVLSELPDYHFLWKFESNISAADLPENVLIRPWLPVSDILADPKVKAIYFHGGMLTTHEAIWRGVPMIIMPFALDQQQNLIKTKRMGIAEGVDYLSLNHNQIRKTILKVLEDPSYSLNARKWSKRFRDQKEKPLDRAMWYIEWLIRNPDCEYLKSPVLRLGFTIGNSYDIIASITVFLTLSLIISLKLFSCCVRKSFKLNYSKPLHKKVD